MKILAIIPARGGSKGVPQKNVKILGGKPLIAHSIECAIGSKKVSKIVVSTDCVEIASAANEYDITVIDRPNELAGDLSSVICTVEQVYNFLNEDFDVIVLLQPTSPLRTSVDLDKVIALLEINKTINGVISVVPMDDIHPARMYNMEDGNCLTPYLEEGETLRRQDLKPVYYRNGCFYAVRTKAFFTEKSFMVEKKMAYVMNPNWLANIDSLRDFKLTELLYEDWKNECINYGV